MSSISRQIVCVNNLLSVLLCACVVVANSSPADLGTFAAPGDFSNSGVSTFSVPVEDRLMAIDTYVLAFINYTYIDEFSAVNVTRSEEKGKFGEGKILEVSGPLVHVTTESDVHDHTACHTPLRGTKGRDLPDVPWIALIMRSQCNFEDKVKHVHSRGAIGAIIYNDVNATSLDKMKINDKERNITAILTYKSKGEELIRVVERNDKVFASITPGQKCTKSYNNVNRTSVLFVSISFIILMIISLVWLVFYYMQKFRYSQTNKSQSKQDSELIRKIVSKIPNRYVKSEDKDTENDCCPICIELYKINDCIKTLPCKHEFHKVCIDPWLHEHQTCPMCKMDILLFYGFTVDEGIKFRFVNQQNQQPQQQQHLQQQLQENISPIIIIDEPIRNTITTTTQTIISTVANNNNMNLNNNNNSNTSSNNSNNNENNSNDINISSSNSTNSSSNSSSTTTNTSSSSSNNTSSNTSTSTSTNTSSTTSTSPTSSNNNNNSNNNNSRNSVPLRALPVSSTTTTTSTTTTNNNVTTISTTTTVSGPVTVITTTSGPKTSTIFTGSRESILQLDNEAEDIETEGMSNDSIRREGISPLPQIRATMHERQLSRSSSVDSDSERDVPSPNETTPSLSNWSKNNNNNNNNVKSNDICVGCIAAALTKHPQSEGMLVEEGEKGTKIDSNASTSLPSTLRKYKGNHSAAFCRGITSTQQQLHHYQLQTLSQNEENIECEIDNTDDVDSITKISTIQETTGESSLPASPFQKHIASQTVTIDDIQLNNDK